MKTSKISNLFNEINKMKRFGFVMGFFCVLSLLVGCGAKEPSFQKQNLPKNNSNSIKSLQEDDIPVQFPAEEEEEEENYFTQNQTIDLAQHNIEEFSVLAVAKLQCLSKKKEHEVSCLYDLTPLVSASESGIEISDQKIIFHEPGYYMAQIKKKTELSKNILIKVRSSEKSLAESISDFELHSYKDSFYDTLYHFDLTALLSDISQVKEMTSIKKITWEIAGGRYYVFDEDTQYLKKLRPFQRTILFLQKSSYNLTVHLWNQEGKEFRKQIVVDLSGFEKPSHSMKANFESDKLQFGVGEEVALMGRVDEPQLSYRYQWQVQKLNPVSCPQGLAEFEPRTTHEVCDRFYEEEVVQGQEYSLNNAVSKDTSIVFHTDGKYVIEFIVLDENQKLLTHFSKSFLLDNALLSSR